MLRFVASGCIVLLVAGSCGGTGEIDDQAAIGVAPSGAELVGLLDDPEQLQGPIRRANRLIDHLGSEANAVDSLLLGFERGYDTAQIESAVADLTLLVDGTIDGENPNRAPLGRIELDAGASNHAAGSQKPIKRPARRLAQDGKVLVERLRGSVIEHGAADAEVVTGLNGVSTILVLLDEGFSPEQIIEIIVLGVVFHESPPGNCYSQALPLSKNERVPRPCDREASAERAPEETKSSDTQIPADGPAEPVPEEAAVYQGEIGAGFAESQVDIVISVEGTVTGSLTATEELENYIASIDFGCGLFNDEEDCSDTVVECPATSIWSADLSSLTFVGDPPDNGTGSGTITITFDTTPRGCGEPVSESQPVEIVATVQPDQIEITAPLAFTLERVEPAD